MITPKSDLTGPLVEQAREAYAAMNFQRAISLLTEADGFEAEAGGVEGTGYRAIISLSMKHAKRSAAEAGR